MFCPECNHQLSPITVPTRGNALVLDYCGQCGGIWTDHAETNFFESTDLATVEAILPKNPTKELNGTLTCPHDKTLLEQMEHESVPMGVTVRHCPTCGGNWFPSGELKKFKKAQQVKLDYHKTWNIPLHSIYAILLPTLVLAVLVSGLIGGVISLNRQQSGFIQAEELISTPSVILIPNKAILVIFATQKPATASLTYWVDETQKETIEVSLKLQSAHEVQIPFTDMTRSMQYQISVSLEEKTITSPIHHYPPLTE